MTLVSDAPFDIVVLVTPHFNMATTVAYLDPFRAANYLQGKTLFRWRVASVAGGPCLASNGLTLQTEALGDLSRERADVVLVSSSWTPRTFSNASLNAALWRFARQGSVMAGLDTGAFILAEAGLLTQRTATVHYEHIDAFGETYPQITVSEDLFVFDGNRATCSGGSAATDFALVLLQELHGDGLANAAAKYLFHARVRPSGSRQTDALLEPMGNTAPQQVRRAIEVMEQHLETPVSVDQICRQINISQRQLGRLFRRHVQTSPSLYYRDIRLDRARGLVTQTELPMSEIALASGFSGQVHFSRAYKARFGLPPSKDRVEGRVPFEFRAWPMHRKTD